MELKGNNTTLAEVNAYERSYKLPSFVLLGLLTVFGIIGNMFVLYIYGCVIRKKKVQHFITLLAIYDIICCFLGLPLKMLEQWMPVTYPSGILCKIENSVICFACVASALTLLIISIDRYKKVCRPTKKQMTLTHVKISSVVITFTSLMFAVTAGFVFDLRDEPSSTGHLMFHVCLMDNTAPITQAYFMALMLVLVIVLVSLLVLYCLVWRTAKDHSGDSMMARYQGPISRCVSQISHVKKPPKTNTTRILVSISLLFVISFLPSLIFSIVFGNLFEKNFSFTASVFIEIVYTMWGLNSSMNPIIYGFCNRNFKLHVLNLFARFGLAKRHSTSITSNDMSGTS